ncbi:MAG: CDP-alcohol phosphatidyltransferase family protein [Phycicoccus sp.]
MTTTLTARPHRVGQAHLDHRHVATAANAVTVARTVAATVLGVGGIATESFPMLLVGLVVHGVGDVLDGAVARRLAQETQLGAVLDVVGSRWCCGLLVAGLVSHLPGMQVAIGIFLAQLLLVDAVLSLSFLRWGLLGPGDLRVVDRRVWALNWSRRARTTDAAALLLCTFGGVPALGVVVALGVALVKTWSLAVVVSVAPPAGAAPSTADRTVDPRR